MERIQWTSDSSDFVDEYIHISDSWSRNFYQIEV